MQKLKKKTKVAGMVLHSATLLFMSGCDSPTPSQLENNPPQVLDLASMEVPAGFDFATTKVIQVRLTFDKPDTSRAAPPKVRVGFPVDSASMDRVLEGWIEPDGSYGAALPVASWRDRIAVEVEEAGGIRYLVLPIQGGNVMYPGPTLQSSWFPFGSEAAWGGSSPYMDGPAAPARIPEDLSHFPIAYVSYFPSESTFGTMAFEDNWPSKGDYDFNDLVLSYQMVQYRNPAGDVVAMEMFLKLEAAGADFSNGLGIRLPIDRKRIISVSGNLTSQADEKGLEPGQSEAVMIAFDKVSSLANSGGMLNTLFGTTFVDVPAVRLVIQFLTPLKDSELGIPPFDPFLIVNGDRGREVHLIGQTGTEKVNPDYFGTEDDVGSYRTANGLPWALLLPEPWTWPREKQPVHLGHLEFVDWAQSGGLVYTDWYVGKGSNRDESFLFMR
jgi:LruC domain-containing protein